MAEKEKEEVVVLTPKDAAKRLHCSVSMIYKLFNNYELQGYCVGWRKHIFAWSVDEFIEANANKKPTHPVKPATPSKKQKGPILIPPGGFRFIHLKDD